MLKMNELQITRYPKPADTMEQIELDIGDLSDIFDISGLVAIREDVYRKITEDGVVKMIEEGIYTTLEKNNDPMELIAFAKWQINKIPREKAAYLADYLHWYLAEEYPNHLYKMQWEAFLIDLKRYSEDIQSQYVTKMVIERVFPAEGNRVYCLCRDGNFRIYDASQLVKYGAGVFAHFKDPAFFFDKAGTINNTLAWDVSGDKNPYKCIDVDPQAIYDSECITMEKIVELADTALHGKTTEKKLDGVYIAGDRRSDADKYKMANARRVAEAIKRNSKFKKK